MTSAAGATGGPTGLLMICTKRVRGDLDEFLAAQDRIVRTAREADGALEISMYRSAQDPATVVLIERWASRAQLDQWIAGPAMRQHVAEHEPPGSIERDFHILLDPRS